MFKGIGLNKFKHFQYNAFLLGLVSLAWFLLRTGRKPSRAIYPCQQVAAANSQIWLMTYVFPIFSIVSKKKSMVREKSKLLFILILLIASSMGLYGWLNKSDEDLMNQEDATEGIVFSTKRAESEPSSDIYVVSGTSGNDGGVADLIDLMGSHRLLFYKSERTSDNQGPEGLIASDDVVIIKVNSQWDERGGTNTDVIKAIIQAVLDHPDGFSGEVIVADNGQGQYGSSGHGGSLDWVKNNAEDASQSVQKVVDCFDGLKVSTYLWDAITTTRVNEYAEGDMEDGYIVNATANPRTGIMVSYPKFRTKFGTYVSFKHGIWDAEAESYDVERLKVINVPVLKSHSIFGVTACVKHYMGVPSDKLTSRLGTRAHSTVGHGGMGTQMVETRFPTLNILDAIWVNANPAGYSPGPSTPYDRGTKVNAVLASTDPVALDYWAAKNILLKEAPEGADVSSIDPDLIESGSFGSWLRLSMEEIIQGGFQVTVNMDHVNVYLFEKGS